MADSYFRPAIGKFMRRMSAYFLWLVSIEPAAEGRNIKFHQSFALSLFNKRSQTPKSKSSESIKDAEEGSIFTISLYRL